HLLARLPWHEACELGEEVVGGVVEPGARDVVVPVRKKAWEAALGGEEAARPYVRARLAGWPARPLVDRDSLPRTDREFVARLARDTWRGLEALTDRDNHLPIDNVRFGGASVSKAEARVGDYTNVTSVGLRLLAIIAAQDYRFFYDAARRRMSHGYYVHLASQSRYHYGTLYAESRLGSLIAIGKGDVPEEHWFAMARTFAPSCRWQTQTPHGRLRKEVRGQAFFGGWYEWKGAKYVPSWGGSMFEALMPALVLDEARWAPGSLGANAAAHVDVQRRFAVEELGYPVWGMSPSMTPARDVYGEYGVRVLGVLGYGPGAVTPHAAALALGVAPEAAGDLRELARR